MLEDVADQLENPCRACGSRDGIHSPEGWVCAYCGWRVGTFVDPDLPPPRVDVVYYLRHGERVKIGTTANPRQRFAAIWHEQVLAFERGDRTLEHQRHEQFADDRFTGSEWFRMSPRLSAHIAAIAADDEDPWRVYARWVVSATMGR